MCIHPNRPMRQAARRTVSNNGNSDARPWPDRTLSLLLLLLYDYYIWIFAVRSQVCIWSLSERRMQYIQFIHTDEAYYTPVPSDKSLEELLHKQKMVFLTLWTARTETTSHKYIQILSMRIVKWLSVYMHDSLNIG